MHPYGQVVIPSWLTRRTALTSALAAVGSVATTASLEGVWKFAAVVVLAVLAVLAVIQEHGDAAAAAEAQAARSSLDVQVTLVPDVIERTADPEPFIHTWTETERRICLRSAQPEPAPLSGVASAALSAQTAGLQALLASMDAQSKVLAGVFDGMSSPENRNEEEYRQEVEEHLDRATAGMRAQVLCAEVRAGASTVRVEIRNSTDRNYVAVEVAIYLPGDVHGVDPGRVEPAAGLPDRPRAFGTRRAIGGLGYGLAIPGVPRVPGPPRRRPSIDNGGSVKVTYPPIDLRPSQCVTLDPIHIITALADGTVIAGTWSATATNTDGKATGDLSLTVRDSTFDVDGVLTSWTAGDPAADD